MSERHPIIAITGSSGSGTTTVQGTFNDIFRREGVNAVMIEGDGFHAFDRKEMGRRQAAAEHGSAAGYPSHFGAEGNLLAELETLFRSYAEHGTGRRRRYLHDANEAEPYGQEPGTFTAWEDLPLSDVLFYEGLHGGVVTDTVNVAQYPDVLIGVVPVINLEWIQKIHRDRSHRGYSTEAVTDVILRRMHDYVHYICPQFSRTHVNFQRVPTVDTSNPFISRHVPAPDESMVVIRFAYPDGIDFPYLLNMIHNSFMSRANTIVVPGGKMDLAMQLIFTPFIWRLMERREEALRR